MTRLIVFGFAICLSACGFTPMHSPQGGLSQNVMSDISVELVKPISPINSEGGYWLQQSLYDRLGRHGNGTAVLRIVPTTRKSNLGVNARDIATRYDLTSSVKYELVDPKDGTVLTDGTLTSVSSFGATRDPYNETQSEKVSIRNQSEELADRLVNRIAAYYAGANRENNP